MHVPLVVESLNARFRQATRRRGHFPTEQAALKVLHLVIRSPRKNGPTCPAKPRGEDGAERAVALLRRPHHPQLKAITSSPTKIRTVPMRDRDAVLDRAAGELTETLPPDDPVIGEMWYWLRRMRDAAREADDQAE